MDEPEDVMQGDTPVTEEQILQFHKYEIPKVAKLTEAASRMVAARDWGCRKMGELLYV
jgi:hypothetical protein